MILTPPHTTGNSLVLAVLYNDRRLHSRSNALIKNLAVADLCVGAWTMPVTFASILNQDWVSAVAVTSRKPF